MRWAKPPTVPVTPQDADVLCMALERLQARRVHRDKDRNNEVLCHMYKQPMVRAGCNHPSTHRSHTMMPLYVDQRHALQLPLTPTLCGQLQALQYLTPTPGLDHQCASTHQRPSHVLSRSALTLTLTLTVPTHSTKGPPSPLSFP